MHTYVLRLQEIDRTKFMLAGGKGANLGELCRIDGIHVPDGFCVTTEAYKKVIRNNHELNNLLDQLKHLKAEEREGISKIGAQIRLIIESTPIARDIEEEITDYIAVFGEKEAFAVRSSATAEDLPTASFAGQQDTFLNIVGKEEILRHISKCWASLFTDRAIIYRMQNRFEHSNVFLSVIVQRMVLAQASGILFTADPVTGNRKLLTIEAGFGLGEALVTGMVSSDCYQVKDLEIVDKRTAIKEIAIHAVKAGGTLTQQIDPDQQELQTLTDDQILQLARTGRQIEEYFGSPQDIEWCVANDIFYIVQSRPITTLYPVPAPDDGEYHVYISVGHQQMMTDAMKPLGLSFFGLTTNATMRKAGGRMFVDVTQILASPASRENLLKMMGGHDPLMKDALITIIERGDLVKSLAADTEQPNVRKSSKERVLPDFETLNEYDPSIVYELISRSEREIEVLKENIESKSGPDLFNFILEDIGQLKKSLFDPQSFGVIMTAMNAASWVNGKMKEWLGETNVADTLSQSVPNNVTSEMGLALLDVADVIRPYPEVIKYLQQVKDDNFLDELITLNGGQVTRTAIGDYLNKYGMRCAGEIDITKTRWSEKPLTLVPLILSNIKNFEPGAARRKFEEGQNQASKKEHELMDRLKDLPGGEEKAKETKKMIGLIRDLAGFREYPKFGMVNRYFVYKQALLKQADQLVHAGIINEREDICYLTFEELREAVSHAHGTNKVDFQVIMKRKEEFKLYEKLTPPRVITSDGEIITGTYKRGNLPPGAIVGLAVSSGIIEGRARVILRMEDADIQDGDILVTPFTDPSWTPLFVSIKGLVTEVGGLMTHGAVIAREYGLPAVVGVEHASRVIKDGQRIRVNGTGGYVEIL